MTRSWEYEGIVEQTAKDVVEDCKQLGDKFAPEEEAQFIQYVQGLVNAEPPTGEQMWQTMEIAREAIKANFKDKSLRAINLFILEFISGCDASSGALRYLSVLKEAKDAIKAGRFDQAGDFMATFLAKCREAARMM